MSGTTASIIVAFLSLLGTLAGSYFSNKKSTALIAYRIEQLEAKVNKHNKVIERTYELEKQEAILEHDIEELKERLFEIEAS